MPEADGSQACLCHGQWAVVQLEFYMGENSGHCEKMCLALPYDMHTA